MRKGRLLTALVIIGVLVVPFSVFAATSDSTAAKAVRGFFGIDTSKLTTQQKTDAANYSKRIADLQKEFIDKMVQNGTMTKEEGDAAKQKIDETYKSAKDNNGIYGLTPGKGMGGGFDKQRGFGKGFIDTSKLTGKQKSDINATAAKINNLHKSFMDTAVNDGLLTKAQGDAIKSKLEAMQKAENGKMPGIMGMAVLPGADCFRFFGNDTSKLTDQQKKDIDAYKQSLSALRKELVGKYVAAGVITQEQGDAMLQRMEQKPGMEFIKGFGKGMMKGGGFHRGKTAPGDNGTTTGSSVSTL